MSSLTTEPGRATLRSLTPLLSGGADFTEVPIDADD
jgi:hypothetical protein